MSDKFGIRREGIAILRNSDGKFIVQDGGHVLIEQGGTEYVLHTQGGTDRILIAPCCCYPVDGNGDPLCGECVDPLPATVSVDFGLWGMINNSPGNYSDTCAAPCATLNGEFILDEFILGAITCSFLYEDNSFCSASSVQQLTGGGDFYTQTTYKLFLWAQVGYQNNTWTWTILCRLQSDASFGFYSSALYYTPATTVCTNKTYTVPRISIHEVGSGEPPCKKSSSGLFEWPDTIDLIVPLA